MLEVKTYFKRHLKIIKCRYIFIKELSKIARKSTVKRIYDNEGNLISKECSRCHEIKPASEFGRDKRAKDGLQTKCKECAKKYRQENKEHIKEYKKTYDQENKDKINKRRREYRQENKDKIIEKEREYCKNNFNRIKEYQKEYNKKYYQENSGYIKRKSKEYNDKKIQEALQQIKTEVEVHPKKYNCIDGKKPYGIIYLVHNIKSNKYYVGQTTRGFDNRYPSGWLYKHGCKNNVKEDLELYGENYF